MEAIKGGQLSDPQIEGFKQGVLEKKQSDFFISEDGVLSYKEGRICVPNDEEIKKGKLSPRYVGKKGKLSLRYVGPFGVIERIGEVVYRLALLPALSSLHDVFPISILKKYLHDPSHILSYESLDVDPKLTYEEKSVEILYRKDKVLRNKTVPLVKVLWCNHDVEEATWETEEDMQNEYP